MEATVLDLAQRVESLKQSFDILQLEHGDLRDMPFTPERRLTPETAALAEIEKLLQADSPDQCNGE